MPENLWERAKEALRHAGDSLELAYGSDHGGTRDCRAVLADIELTKRTGYTALSEERMSKPYVEMTRAELGEVLAACRLLPTEFVLVPAVLHNILVSMLLVEAPNDKWFEKSVGESKGSVADRDS